MEKHDEANPGRWVDERMAKTTPDAAWEPSMRRGLTRLREGREAHRSRGRWTMWIAAGATAAVLLFLPTPALRAVVRSCSDFVIRSLSGARMAQRNAMPDFTANDASGRPIALSALRGKVVLLNFWSTSCAQCETERPWFAEFQQRYGGDFAVLRVSRDNGEWAATTPYLDVRATPTTFIIDKSGRIAVKHVGFCSKSEYEADIKALLGEQ